MCSKTRLACNWPLPATAGAIGRIMDAHATRFFRASIVARARFIEDVVVEPAGRGVSQYVSKERAAAGDSILKSTRDRNRCYRPFRAFP